MNSAEAATIMNPDTYVRGVPHVALAELRQGSPVVWLDEPAVDAWPAGPGFWAVLRHADVRHVLRHPEVFSSQLGATQIRDAPTPEALAFTRRMMINIDPPDHSRLRSLLNRAFTPRAIARLEEQIGRWAHDLVAAVAADGQCDFAKVAADLPLLTVAEVFGVPVEDRWLMFDWSNRVIGYQDPDYAMSSVASANATEMGQTEMAQTEMAQRALAQRPEAGTPRRRRHEQPDDVRRRAGRAGRPRRVREHVLPVLGGGQRDAPQRGTRRDGGADVEPGRPAPPARRPLAPARRRGGDAAVVDAGHALPPHGRGRYRARRGEDPRR